jgi:dienelactone hydrolase
MWKRFLHLLVAAASLVALTSGTAQGGGPTPNGWWTGTYTLRAKEAITFRIQGRRALVALGTGHAGAQAVPVTTGRTGIGFRLPGRPAPVAFTASVAGEAVRGTVRDGSSRGAFVARRGEGRALLAPGFYAAGSHELAVVDDPYGPARLVDLGSGGVNALYASGKTFAIGSGFATRSPVRGTARFEPGTAVVSGAHATRRPVRQLEVRFSSGAALLSGTLTIPPGAGPHPAVAFVHGSGVTSRAYLPDLQALLVGNGVAVLAYDKRGVGESAGRYPGESPTAEAINVLARDAQAAVRFLAAQPEIDRSRVGLAGHSQAGWIMPLAASHEPAVRFLVVFSGPSVTADENDLYQDLAGQGDEAQLLSDAEVDARVLARGPGGVDPMPWIRALCIPGLWLYGGLDKHIPPRLSVRRLEPLAQDSSRDFSVEVFPSGNHALVETTTGLTSEMLRSDRFSPGLFAAVAAWLRGHGL